MTNKQRMESDMATMDRRDKTDKLVSDSRIRNDKLTEERRMKFDKTLGENRIRNDELTANRRNSENMTFGTALEVFLVSFVVLSLAAYFILI